MIDNNELGMKSGRGFYQYPDPRYSQPGFVVQAERDELVYHALLAALIGNAVLVAAHEVAEPADIDRAWMTGTYLDAGPFAVLAQIGVANFLTILAEEVVAGRFSADRAERAADYLGRHPNLVAAEGLSE